MKKEKEIKIQHIKDLERDKVLINLRAKLFISQRDLAKILNTTFISISRWENGHFKPSLKMKQKIIKLAEKNKIIYKDN